MVPFSLPAARIAQLIQSPEVNVSNNWPLVENALLKVGMATFNVAIAAIATIRIECPLFKPQTEKYDGDPHEYFKHYDGRYGNTAPGDGYTYRGRGFIQLTFKNNYIAMGNKIGVNLVDDPDLALEPQNAASVLAHYFQDYKVDVAANNSDWAEVRRLVNGGWNGFPVFLKFVTALKNNG